MTRAARPATAGARAPGGRVQAEASPAGPCAPVRWLLVHDLHDAAALWLGRQWHARLPEADRDALLVVGVPALALHARCTVRIEAGRTRSVIRLHLPGRPVRWLDDADLRGVLWRAAGAWSPPAGLVAGAGPAADADGGADADEDAGVGVGVDAVAEAEGVGRAEADYQAQERQAIMLAWLHGLGPVCLARPGPLSLCGPLASPATWRARAAACGMPVWHGEPMGGTVAPRLLVAADAVADLQPAGADAAPLPASVTDAARMLAHRLGCAGLRLDGAPDVRGRWRLHGADPVPDWRLAGAQAGRLVEALARRMGMPSAAAPRSAQPLAAAGAI